jgi:hypothetical protein
MGPFLKSKNSEYILVAVDYVSKWVKAMPCRAADSKNSKKMFEEVIFPRFGVPRMVISDRGTHFIDKNIPPSDKWPNRKHRTSKSRTLYRRLLMRWEQSGRISYPMHCGLIERLTRHRFECPHINSFTGKLVIYR